MPERKVFMLLRSETWCDATKRVDIEITRTMVALPGRSDIHGQKRDFP